MKIKNELIHTLNISVKLLFFCGLIFFVSGRLVAGEKDSVIERIWERIINYNSEVMSARRNEEIAGINQDYYWLSFLPSVSISSSPVFSDISKTFSEIPENISSNISITERLPGGLIIGFSPTMSLIRDDLQNDFIKTAVFSVSLSQSLEPFWNDECRKSSCSFEKEQLQLKKELYSAYKDITVLSQIELATDKYISLRKLCRNIKPLESNIKITEEILGCMKQLYLDGQISLTELFLQEQNLTSYEKDLLSCRENEHILLLSLLDILGYSETDNLEFSFWSEMLLEPRPLEENIITRNMNYFSENPSEKYLQIQKRIIENEYNLMCQNNSPNIALQGNFPLTNKNWSMTASFNIPANAFLTKTTLKKEYLENMEDYEQKILKNNYIRKLEKDRYEKLAKLYKSVLEKQKRDFENYKMIYDSKNLSFLNGDITQIELLQTEISYKTAEMNIQNQEDMIWFYKLMSQNRR